MEERRDFRDPVFLQTSSQVGDQLLDLYRDDCPASREFLYIGREVRAFHASYLIIQPYLQAPLYFVSQAGLTLVRSIHDGIETICEELFHDISSFEDQASKPSGTRLSYREAFYAFCGNKPATNSFNRRVERFLERKNRYKLQRCQLRYGNMLLSLVLTVLVYAQNVYGNSTVTFADCSSHLIRDLYKALREIRSKERRARNGNPNIRPSVEATWWWDGLLGNPPPPSPIAALADIWVNADARVTAQPAPNVQLLQDTIRQWREHDRQQRLDFNAASERMSTRNQRLVSDNVQLERDNKQLKDDLDKVEKENGDLEETMDRLNERISLLVDALEAERTARHRRDQDVEYYRKQRDRLRDQLNAVPARGIVELPVPSSNGNESQYTENPPRSSHRRGSSSQDQEGPPMSYETQRRRRRRPTSSNGWSGTTTAVEDQHVSRKSESPRAPPPINIFTRPYRT